MCVLVLFLSVHVPLVVCLIWKKNQVTVKVIELYLPFSVASYQRLLLLLLMLRVALGT